MRRRLIISLSLVAPVAICLCQNQPSARNPKQSEVVVLAVGSTGTKDLVEIEPVLVIRDGSLTAAPYSCEAGDQTTRQFNDQYLTPGKRYRLLFGGAQAGQMTLGGSSGDMPGLKANVEITGTIDQRGWVLATNSPALGRGPSRRRFTSNEEEKVATELARIMFQKIGVSPEDIAGLQLGKVGAISLGDDGSPVLFVSATIERADKMGVEHGIFFAAHREGTKPQWVPELIWHHKAENELDGQRMDFVDNIDLDGDGVDELITELVFYENFRFHVYKQDERNAQWKQILETPMHGCE